VLFSEPKIPQLWVMRHVARLLLSFQCSSASRKFLNRESFHINRDACAEFQCSSASRKFLNDGGCVPSLRVARVSVLFSEPKIPQCSKRVLQIADAPRFQCSSASRKFLNGRTVGAFYGLLKVSVLFSEPKIPQCATVGETYVDPDGFSALQRAENSSILESTKPHLWAVSVSVLFSEPKIPQSVGISVEIWLLTEFQCSSASRKFLNM